MDERQYRHEIQESLNGIHASDALRRKVMNMKKMEEQKAKKFTARKLAYGTLAALGIFALTDAGVYAATKESVIHWTYETVMKNGMEVSVAVNEGEDGTSKAVAIAISDEALQDQNIPAASVNEDGTIDLNGQPCEKIDYTFEDVEDAKALEEAYGVQVRQEDGHVFWKDNAQAKEQDITDRFEDDMAVMIFQKEGKDITVMITNHQGDLEFMIMQ